MPTVYLVLLIIAAVCFLAAANVVSRVNLMAAGLFAWVLVAVIQQAKHLS